MNNASYSVQLAAANKAETGEGDAEEREGGGLGDLGGSVSHVPFHSSCWSAETVTVRSGPSFPVESGSPTMVSTTNGSGHHEAWEP